MRAVCISDTHQHHRELKLPNGTFLIHTGDFTNRGSEQATDDFLVWFSEQPHKHKILIAGNHDFYPQNNPEHFKHKCRLLGINYLEDSGITLEGINFYGTPYVPTFFDWAFMKSEAQLWTHHYSKIPVKTQVLLTHGPAEYIFDEVPRGHVGSSALASRLKELPNLTHHIFGHIHECHGKHRANYMSINAASVDKWYSLRPPILLNIKANSK